MALCRYYQQGYCKFGNSCRFEHPNASNANTNRNPPTNRFGALGAAGGSSSSSGGVQDLLAKYHITPDVIEKDLTLDAPQWILSAYAPGRDAPDQLFGGYPREQSFEELRFHYWIGKASGNEQGALNEAQQLWQNAKQQMENAVRNPLEAAQFIVEGENRHPNRHDVCREGTQSATFGEFAMGKTSGPSNAFGNTGSAAANTTTTTTNTAGAFGQPSLLGQRSNPFGQPSQPASSSSAFGQASQQSASPFGQPSQAQNASPFGGGGGAGPASQGQSAFGQPSQMGSSGSGQPSALGAKPSPFGAPSFGQASQPNAQNNPFGQSQAQAQAQAQTQGSAFGQPSQMGQKPNPFASSATSSTVSPFASAGNNAAASANPFAVAAGQTNAAPNPFATAANQNSSGTGDFAQQSSQFPFGQTSSQGSNAFASSSQGPSSAAGNPFAQQPQQQQQQSPFGQQADGASSFGRNDNANPFGQQQQQRLTNGTNGTDAGDKNSPYAPTSTRQHPAIDNYASRDMTGRLLRFKDKPVSYRDGQPGIQMFDGSWSKIWFPNGPPGFNKDTELPLELYDEGSRARWSQFAQTGAFAGGIMPELPPPRECTQWDF